MSGIVGIFNRDGSPADRKLLEWMTSLVAVRGPDAQRTWASGPVGLGHALLQTASPAPRETQPFTFDNQVWITADARVDARSELIQQLRSRGREVAEGLPDCGFILHAYHVWGEDCLQHLLGDFAFAIWDSPRRRLFCARDHLGVKPFFFANLDGVFLFGSRIESLRAHPAVSGRLNELFIADFLLFGAAEDPSLSAFADIERLPPAHAVSCSEDFTCKRYWAVPITEELRYPRTSQYVEHFRELLTVAVSDRLRTDRAAIAISGGLDSTSVAATAKQALTAANAPFDLHAFTVSYEGTFDDREAHFASIAAEGLGVPLEILRLDRYRLYDYVERSDCFTPEPVHAPMLSAALDDLERYCPGYRVVLTGQGGDPLLLSSFEYLLQLARGLHLIRLGGSFSRFLLAYRRLPYLGGVRTRLKRRFLGMPQPRPDYPLWLEPSFESRLSLRDRWREKTETAHEPHPRNPPAYNSLGPAFWGSVFESYNIFQKPLPFEVRHPLFDLRMVAFLLSIPPIPWCWDKMLIRESMRGVLPESIRTRRKSPLAGDPVTALLKRSESQWVDSFEATPELSAFVVRNRIPSVVDARVEQAWLNLRPLSLNFWLRALKVADYKYGSTQGTTNEATVAGTRQEEL